MAELRRSTRAAATNAKSMQDAETSDEEGSESEEELVLEKKSRRTSKGEAKTPAQAAPPSTQGKRKPPPHPNSIRQTGKKQKVETTGGNKAAAGSKAAKARKVDLIDLEGSSLLDVVKERPAAIPSIVGQFVGRYESNPQAATAELLTFLVQACGSSLTVPEEDLMDETDVDDVIEEIIKAAQEKGDVENYLFSKDKKLKHFRQNLLDFWDLLILECQSNILFDENLVDKCISYVIAISCTAVRTFRQVGTLVGLQLVSSLITVAKSCTRIRETTQRQLQAEKRKKDAARAADLNKTLEDMHSRTTATEEVMRKLFTGVFVNRYRDVDDFIRANCVEALGSWILEYPSMFLKDLYIKYLGWMLNDTDAHVRKTSVVALRYLYEVEDNIASLELFTQRFGTRMLQLAEDIDESVAVEAVKLIKELLRNELLTDEDTSRLYELLVDESTQMRHAVGDLVYEQLITQTLVQRSTPTGKSAKESKTPEGQLKRVLAILAEFSGNRALCSYVVDALWESAKVLQDWKTITKLLLTESAKEELSESDATNLVRLLNSSVKKAHGEKLVKDTDWKAVHLTKAQKEAIAKKEEDLTVIMMKALPALLRKFQADKAKVRDLVEVTAYLKLELYSLKRQEATFLSMLQLVKDIFFKHSDTDTLHACVRALKYSVEEGKAELQDGAQQLLTDVEHEVVKRVKAAVKKAKKSESPQEDFALTVALARAHALFLGRKPQDEDVHQSAVELLDEVDGLDDEVVRFALRLIFLQVAWSLAAHVKDAPPSEEALSHVVELRDKLLQLVELALDNVLELWSEESTQSKLAATVCDLLADTWALFSLTKLKDTKLERLGYSPPDSVVRKFWELTEKRLDAAAEDVEENEEQARNPQADDSLKHEVVLPVARLVKWDLIQKEFLAPELVSHFTLHGKPTAEVIKSMVGRSEEQWRTYLEALKRSFERYLTSVTEDDDYLTNPFYKEFKELAHRISSVYASFAKAQLRPALLKIVKGGMDYAFSSVPRTLPFLEGALVQFAVKLEAADMRALVADANKRAGDVAREENPHAWRPFTSFVEALEAKASGNAGTRAANGKKKGRDGRKLEFDEEDSAEEASGAEPTTPGDQTEQEEEETQPLRDPRRQRTSEGSAAVSYQRKIAEKRKLLGEESEEDEEAARKRRARGKAKAVEGESEKDKSLEGNEPSDEIEDEEVLGSRELGSYNATEEQLPTRRKSNWPQMKPLFGSDETGSEAGRNSDMRTEEEDAEGEPMLGMNVNGKRMAATQASQSPLGSAGGREEAEPVAYKQTRRAEKCVWHEES